MDFIKHLLIALLMMISLHAQYRGVYTSVDHSLGNITTTPLLPAQSAPNANQSKTMLPNTTESIDQRISLHNETYSPLSRSYYLWAETTSSIPFAGGLNTILLAAATVNGYEDIASVIITGPKSGVSATRWDLPMTIQIAYALSAGSIPLAETPTTATPYARSGSTTSFTTTEATPQVSLSYKTSADGAAEGNWSNAFSLTSGTETTAILVPSALESSVHQPYFSFTTFSNFHLALMQSSLRDIAAYSTFRIFPFPTVTPYFSVLLGTPTRNEQVAHTTFLAYSLQTDSVTLPTWTLSASNGFPKTRWEIVHQKPDGSSKILLNTPVGTSPTLSVPLDPTSLKLHELIQTAGTHVFRVYNRFDEASILEAKELIYELTLTVQFVVKVKAHIHSYE